MSGKLSANFSFRFEGNIWNMLLDDEIGTLILEIRESDSHQVSFTAVDLASGEVLWDGLQFEENWWVGMTIIKKGVLILHTYVDNADPEPKGLIAFDIKKKEVRWSQAEFIFLKEQKGKIIGFGIHGEEKHFQSIDLMSGGVEDIEEYLESNQPSEESNEHDQGWPTAYPLHYVEGTTYFDTCKACLYNRLHVEAVKAIEYLEGENKIIISYYTIDGDGLVNYLLVMDLEGKILYNEIIQENIKAIGLQTFFIVKNQVIFVKEKSEIFSVNL